MKKKKELPEVVHYNSDEVSCYDEGNLTVYSPFESKGVVIVQTICQTISNVSRSQENVKVARLSANVKMNEIEKNFASEFREEENIHNEVMSNLTNITSAIDIIKNNPKLCSDKDVIINLLDSINDVAKQAMEVRRNKQKK